MDKIAFVDVALNTLLIFVLLFTLAFLNISEKKVQDYTKPPVEYMVTMDWPNGMKSDIDIWLQLPDGSILFFRDKDHNTFVLDRDDLGNRNSCRESTRHLMVCDETNREVLTIRAIEPGDYILNIHMYRQKDSEQVPVTINFEKLNPSVVSVYKSTTILTKQWEEVTLLQFTIFRDGSVGNKHDEQESLVAKKLESTENPQLIETLVP